MDTKELMIGNYVLRHTGEITKVLEVLTSMVRIKAEGYNSIKSITIPSRSISPIILTEEDLLKLGFEKYFTNKFYNKSILITNKPNNYKLLPNEWLINKECIINYVHELQNYYYLHTKEHLEYDFTK